MSRYQRQTPDVVRTADRRSLDERRRRHVDPVRDLPSHQRQTPLLQNGSPQLAELHPTQLDPEQELQQSAQAVPRGQGVQLEARPRGRGHHLQERLSTAAKQSQGQQQQQLPYHRFRL